MGSTDSVISEHDQQRILGSAESLSPEETAERLRALAAWGVDLSLIQASLELTPTERLQRMMDIVNIGAALHQSYLQAMSRRRATCDEPGEATP